tara:strand:- start:177 stop:437 length:261 start_codon:yes stop_codon:yes gene_type:complete
MWLQARQCTDAETDEEIEKVKLTIVNFKMDGRRDSAGKDATENDSTGGKGDNREYAACNPVSSVPPVQISPLDHLACLATDSWLLG